MHAETISAAPRSASASSARRGRPPAPGAQPATRAATPPTRSDVPAAAAAGAGGRRGGAEAAEGLRLRPGPGGTGGATARPSRRGPLEWVLEETVRGRSAGESV
jgi:hypothetical protein